MDWSCTRFLVSFVSRSVSVFFPSVSLYSLFAMITPRFFSYPTAALARSDARGGYASPSPRTINSRFARFHLLFPFTSLFPLSSLSHTLLSSPVLS